MFVLVQLSSFQETFHDFTSVISIHMFRLPLQKRKYQVSFHDFQIVEKKWNLVFGRMFKLQIQLSSEQIDTTELRFYTYSADRYNYTPTCLPVFT